MKRRASLLVESHPVTASDALPVIAMYSNGFQDGFQQANNPENGGWNTEQAPTEDSIVQFIEDLLQLRVTEDLTQFEWRWCLGLLAGWLRRTEF